MSDDNHASNNLILRDNNTKPAPAQTVLKRLIWWGQYSEYRRDSSAPAPDHGLLIDEDERLVKHRSVKQAVVCEIDGRPAIGWRVRATNRPRQEYPDELRRFRWVDPITYATLDAATWFGGAIFFNTLKHADRGERHYPCIFRGPGKTHMLDVIDNTPLGLRPTVLPGADHHDLRVCVLGEPHAPEDDRIAGRQAKGLVRDREFFLGVVGQYRSKFRLKSQLNDLSDDAHERILRLGFQGIDALRAAGRTARLRAAE